MEILNGLAEGQVLQRRGSKGATVEITGTCPESGTLTFTIASKKGALKGWKNRVAGRAADGKFAVRLTDVPAGGPYRLELHCNKSTTRIGKFFVGDVWVLAGQSNMQGIGNMSDAPPSHPLIHAFTMRREWMRAAEPLHLLAESPDFCHNGGIQSTPEESARSRRFLSKGVGPGLFFAHEMLRRTGVPQGLICAAHGGTSMAQWSPERVLDGRTSMYGSLLESVEANGQPVAGILWYQGESDANAQDIPLYSGRMRKLVSALRKDLRQPGLPWLTVQIGRFFGDRSAAEGIAWNQIQEMQRLLPRVIKNLAVVAAIDLPMDDEIHISSTGHPRLAARLAREADRLVLGNRRETMSPQLRSISSLKMPKNVPQVPGVVVEVEFDNVVGELHAAGEPSGFAIVDKQSRDLHAVYKTTLHGKFARLHVQAINPEIATLCYGAGTAPVCNIMDARGHALPVFSPKQLGKPRAYLPFVKQWKVTPPVHSEVPLDRIAAPDADAQGAEVRTYGENEFGLDGFVNEHPRWEGRHGHCYFSAWMRLPESMRLEFLMGYDGPFRLWVDDRPLFTDMSGINPCFPDERGKIAALSAGTHSIRVGMDLNHGQAWGFFLRFNRRDITPAQIKSGKYKRPVYGV